MTQYTCSEEAMAVAHKGSSSGSRTKSVSLQARAVRASPTEEQECARLSSSGRRK